MRHFILILFLTFSYNESKAGSFSTIFGSEGSNSVKENPTGRALSYSLQYLTFTGITGYFTKQLFETGFFEPIGFVPESYKSLSPLAYDKNLIITEKLKIHQNNNMNLFKLKKMQPGSNFSDLKISKYLREEEKRKLLIEKYFDQK